MRGMYVVTVCVDAVSFGIRRLAPGGQGLVPWLVGGLATAVRTLAFWTAVLLPLAYLPLYLAGDPRVTSVVAIGQLIALNVVALLLGHCHDGAVGQGFDRAG